MDLCKDDSCNALSMLDRCLACVGCDRYDDSYECHDGKTSCYQEYRGVEEFQNIHDHWYDNHGNDNGNGNGNDNGNGNGNGNLPNKPGCGQVPPIGNAT